jgi:hypothetical protein
LWLIATFGADWKPLQNHFIFCIFQFLISFFWRNLASGNKGLVPVGIWPLGTTRHMLCFRARKSQSTQYLRFSYIRTYTHTYGGFFCLRPVWEGSRPWSVFFFLSLVNFRQKGIFFSKIPILKIKKGIFWRGF